MAENLISSPAYRVAFSMYVALGGDPNMTFDSVDAIYAAIDELYGKGTRVTIENLSVEITENGGYLYDNEEITGYKPVSVNVSVPQKYTDEQVESLKETARQEGYDSGYDLGVADGFIQGESEGYNDGYAEGLEDGAADQKALLEAVTVTKNGTYTKEDGYNQVTVAVPMPEIPTFETEELSVELTENGTYNYTPTTDGYSKVDVTVNVASSGGGGNVDFSMLGYNASDWNALYNILLDKSQKGVSLYETWDPSKTSIPNLYGTPLFPKIDTSNLTTAASLFTTGNYDATNYWGGNLLIYVPLFDTSKVTTMDSMFYGQNSLKTVPHFNTSKVTKMTKMFYNCWDLTDVPLFDTSKVTTMEGMFYRCCSLKNVPHFDTSNVTSMKDFLSVDYARPTPLTAVPLFDTSKVTTMSGMLSGQMHLTEVPLFDTSSVTSMYSMLSYCQALTTIPQFNTSKVTDMGYMLQNCKNLESIPLLDAGEVTTISNFFGSNDLTKLTYIGGFKDLGKKSSVSGTNTTGFLYRVPYMTKESIMNIINNLYDRATAGLSVLTLRLNSRSLAALTDDEKAIATNKGWTLS